ncbi:MAG: hypothetical protein IJH87_04040 [Atopobiaceae bacterium]|nr:hypothetical protein [Atopobiaceae bacterium]
MSRTIIPDGRQWLSMSEAGVYAGVSPKIIKAGIVRGDLTAYPKPLTQGRKPGALRRNDLYRISMTDIDTWIREYWPTYAEDELL